MLKTIGDKFWLSSGFNILEESISASTGQNVKFTIEILFEKSLEICTSNFSHWFSYDTYSVIF